MEVISMEYKVKVTDTIDWNKVEKAHISSYTWGKEYMPEAYAQLVLVEGKGFALRMHCNETTPRTTYFHYNDPVYKDSAMEFFASFNNNTDLYMNFEMNSAGAFLSAVRVDRKNKTPIDKIVDVAQITVHSEKDENGWTVEAFYPLNVIAKLFDVSEFPHGYRFKGNFYKCGDDTDIPHFGSWAPIDLEKPDFHCPAFFGDLVIG